MRSPSPPLTIGRLWYDLQEVDAKIQYVEDRLQDKGPEIPCRVSPEVREAIRKQRSQLLQSLKESREDLVLEAMREEENRHYITLQEMRKLLGRPSVGAVISHT